MDNSPGKPRVTLAQLTLELLQLKVDQLEEQEGRVPPRSDFLSEDPVASQIALAMTKHQAS